MYKIEIQTIEGKRLEWVEIYGSTDPQDAIHWGDVMKYARYPKNMSPNLRITNKGAVVGAWQADGYEWEENE